MRYQDEWKQADILPPIKGYTVGKHIMNGRMAMLGMSWARRERAEEQAEDGWVVVPLYDFSVWLEETEK